MRRYLAESIATFFLLFIGTGSVIMDHITHGAITLLGISIITGLIVTIMILLLGKYSGAHMNPAVSLVMYLNGDLKHKELLFYLLSQAIGAFAGTFLLSVLFSHSSTLGETIPNVNYFSAFVIELILTYALLLVILYSADGFPKLAPWLIGGYVALGIFLGGNYSGGSMNPIRSLSPAVLNNNTADVWLFLTAPFVGGVLALVTFKKYRK